MSLQAEELLNLHPKCYQSSHRKFYFSLNYSQIILQKNGHPQITDTLIDTGLLLRSDSLCVGRDVVSNLQWTVYVFTQKMPRVSLVSQL